MSAENGKPALLSTQMPLQPPTTTKIKREPGGIGNMPLLTNGSATIKLSSFSPARDLTLGGRGGCGALGSANKKVFTPNLNVVRNKNANVKTSKDTTARGRGGRGKSDRGRGSAAGGRGGRGGGANSSFIQTTGVFSEGAGAVNIRKVNSGGGGGSGSFGRSADEAASAMRKPMIVRGENQKLDIKADAAQVRELLGDSEDDDFEDEKTELEHIPIKLNEAKWKQAKLEIPTIKSEKMESNDIADDDDNNTAGVVQQIQQMKMHQRSLACMSRYPKSVEELLESKQPQIFVMQLPDTLPCEDDGNDSPEKNFTTADQKEQSTSDSANSTPAKKTYSSSNSFKKMEEGQVGKLLRYKSGKIKLVLGESYFDLDMGMETGFLQDLMSITTNRDERSGNMINLGTIQAKLTATPDWEYLLKQQLAAQQKP